MKKLAASGFLILLASCSVFNPNPGENEADNYIQKKQYEQAIEIIEPLAQQGIPWAQLRLGIAYEYGQGKKQNLAEASNWYRKAAVQSKDLPWADGLHILSAGEDGFFNQNNDAKVAQYLLARLYAQGGSGVEKNLVEAWKLANQVHTGSQGDDVLFCCENTKLKPQHIKFTRIETLLREIETQLPAEQLTKLKANSAGKQE